MVYKALPSGPSSDAQKESMDREVSILWSAVVSIKEFMKLIYQVITGDCFGECLLERTWTSCICLGSIPWNTDY